MMVRPATVQDLEIVKTLVSDFIHEYVCYSTVYRDHEHALESTVNQQRLQTICEDWIRNHYVILAFDVSNNPVGVMAAQRSQDFWDPAITELREIAWYVMPKYRKSRISAALWSRWQRDTTRLIEEQKITYATLSLPEGRESVDLTRRGWRPVERHWIKG